MTADENGREWSTDHSRFFGGKERLAINSLLSKRFAELIHQFEEVNKTQRTVHSDFGSDFRTINESIGINWTTKAKNLLGKACGENSVHLKEFITIGEKISGYEGTYDIILKQKSIFEAAQEDYDGGYCDSIRSIVQAEVFSDELEQSKELLKSGFHPAAAVIAGVVLETTLRDLCGKHQIPTGKLDKMNADLAKAGQYNLLKQKQITAWADLRNKAAHGKWKEFTKEDVEAMILAVEGFVADHI